MSFVTVRRPNAYATVRLLVPLASGPLIAKWFRMAQPTKAKIRVLLVDDHAVVRMGVRAMVEATDDLVVVGEADSATGALREALRTRPDVVVMDVRLASESGISATRAIRAALPEAQVLMLTSFADDEALFASVMAGAAGYVLKQIRGDDLVRGIRGQSQVTH